MRFKINTWLHENLLITAHHLTLAQDIEDQTLKVHPL